MDLEGLKLNAPCGKLRRLFFFPPPIPNPKFSVGEDWQASFMQALETSAVVVLIISQRTLDGIAKNAAVQQDNVLLEWCARPRFLFLCFRFAAFGGRWPRRGRAGWG